VVFGAGYGGVSPLFPVVAEDLHGRERLGTTFGLMGVGIGLGAGVGSSAIGVLRDRLGSYDSIILVPILSLVAGVAVMASVTRGRGTS
jgi:predicted MFS family arabinose efflux permease